MAILACNGGTPLRSKPFPKWTMTTALDEQELRQTYNSDHWGMDGEKNRSFQEKFAAYAGVKHCLTVANGTVTIELILRALGIGRGDEVIVPPYTFIASISSLIYAGVKPVFADIEPDTFQMSVADAEKRITPRTRAIMPVYVGGRPADLDGFEALCKKYGLYLIGDAAQAVGAVYNGRGVGAYGIATSISCQNTKNLTSGEGGLILTNDDRLYDTLQQMLRGGMDEAGNYSALGLFGGMSEFQASMLDSQFSVFPEQVQRRKENGAYLDSRLAELDFVEPLRQDPKITCNAYHLYMFRLLEDKLDGVDRATFLNAVNAEGVTVSGGYMPVYTFPCLKGSFVEQCIGSPVDCDPGTPVAEQISRHEGCWLLQEMLLGTREDMDDIVNALIKVYRNLDELR